jgi:hypothetical protein
MQTAYAAGNGPTVWNLPIENSHEYIENGLVAPVDYEVVGFKNADDMRNQYADGMIDAVYQDGDFYGIPLELTNWCIYVDKAVFRLAGLDPEKDYPKTWEDMVEVSKKIVLRDGDIITRRGFDFRYSYSLTYFVPMVEQLGGSLSDTEGCVNEEAWIKALTFMKNWGPSGENLGNSTMTAPRKLFNKHNLDIAMANTGLYQESRILSENPDFYNSGDWMVVSLVVGGKSKSSIHRPELCLPAQGLRMERPRTRSVAGRDWRFIDLASKDSPTFGFAYTFFNQEGFKTASHVSRIFRDVVDRSVLNRIDRWVMVTVNASRSDDVGLSYLLSRIELDGGNAK